MPLWADLRRVPAKLLSYALSHLFRTWRAVWRGGGGPSHRVAIPKGTLYGQCAGDHHVVVRLAIARLEFHARPWNPVTWRGAIAGWLFLDFLPRVEEEPRVPTPERAAHEVCETSRLAQT